MQMTRGRCRNHKDEWAGRLQGLPVRHQPPIATGPEAIGFLGSNANSIQFDMVLDRKNPAPERVEWNDFLFPSCQHGAQT